MTSSEKSISRRSFLGLTGAAATITAAAGLYGCAQPASSSGGSLASTKGSAAGPIEAVSAPASWDEEADVVVVGTGGGLVAAAYAAQAGKKVVVLERRAPGAAARRRRTTSASWEPRPSRPSIKVLPPR